MRKRVAEILAVLGVVSLLAATCQPAARPGVTLRFSVEGGYFSLVSYYFELRDREWHAVLDTWDYRSNSVCYSSRGTLSPAELQTFLGQLDGRGFSKPPRRGQNEPFTPLLLEHGERRVHLGDLDDPSRQWLMSALPGRPLLALTARRDKGEPPAADSFTRPDHWPLAPLDR